MLDYRDILRIGGIVADTGKRSGRQAHELRRLIRLFDALLVQAFGHTGDEKLHNPVRTIRAMPHEIKRPTDDFAVAVGRQPAGRALHHAVGVNRIQQHDPRIAQLLDTAERELHFRQRLEFSPLLGNADNLLAHLPRRLVERGQYVGHAAATRLVDGRADILPLLAACLPGTGDDQHLRTHLDGRAAQRFQGLASVVMHRVEGRGPRVTLAEAHELAQRCIEFTRVTERAGHGQRHTMAYTVGDRRTAARGEPIMIVLPCGHETHRFAATLHQLAGALAVCSVQRHGVAEPQQEHHEHHNPEHQSGQLVDDHRCHRSRMHMQPA